jgi:hypothetical protein
MRLRLLGGTECPEADPEGASTQQDTDALTLEVLVNYTVFRNMYRGPADALKVAHTGIRQLGNLSGLNDTARGMLDTLNENMRTWESE